MAVNSLEKLVLFPRPRRLAQRLDSESALPAQGYRLRITAAGPRIEAADAAGEFYARMTLRQLKRQCGEQLPVCEIEDWPDFAARGLLLDISRDKVPTMETLFALVELLAEWKLNQLQLYTEHTFAYREHREVWEGASPLVAEEIRALDAFCRERWIELVPNQQSFGHFERWLEHERYRPLAASGRGNCLDPANPAALSLLEQLYAELLPNFSSRQFNVNCDETRGIEPAAYVRFLLGIHELVQRNGRRMQFWGDVVLGHPELLGRLPREAVVLAWGYEANHPFDALARRLAESGLAFYVCPGTSSWNSIAGRADNCLQNVRAAAVAGRRHGAAGLLVTDWGDNGHWQYLPVSYLGVAAAAALGWCEWAHRDADILGGLEATTGVDAAVAWELGTVYRLLQYPMRNATALFQLLFQPPSHPVFAAVKPRRLEACLERVETAAAKLAGAGLMEQEFRNAARMLAHACRRGLGRAQRSELREIIGEHRRLWLARNRPGGLEHSAGLLERRFADYADFPAAGACN